jgi:hypothetical protein
MVFRMYPSPLIKYEESSLPHQWCVTVNCEDERKDDTMIPCSPVKQSKIIANFFRDSKL